MDDEIRGAAIRAFASWYGRELGTDRLRQALVSLSPEQQRFFDASRLDLGVQVHTWYPAPAIHHLLEGILRGLAPAAVDEIVRRAAREIIETSLTGVLELMFRLFISPDVCRMFSQQLWDFHYRSGRLRVTALGGRGQRMEVWDWRSHHPVLCQLNAAAGVPIMGATGCREVRSRVERCIGQGDPCCVYLTEWR